MERFYSPLVTRECTIEAQWLPSFLGRPAILRLYDTPGITPSTYRMYFQLSHFHVELTSRPGLEVIKLEVILRFKIKRNDWLLADTRVRVRKQTIIALYFESETVLSIITSRPEKLNPRHAEYFYAIHASPIFILLACNIPVIRMYYTWSDGFIKHQLTWIYMV